MTVSEADERVEGGGEAPASQRGAPVFNAGFLDELMSRVQSEGLELTGPDGLLDQLTRQVLERALEEEMTDHLGYERGDPAGAGSGNSRNGLTGKTLTTDIGPVPVTVPRDRSGTFEPVIVPKGARRLGGLSDMIVSLYAKGMTVRDIADHLGAIYGASCGEGRKREFRPARRPSHRQARTPWPRRTRKRSWSAVGSPSSCSLMTSSPAARAVQAVTPNTVMPRWCRIGR